MERREHGRGNLGRKVEVNTMNNKLVTRAQNDARRTLDDEWQLMNAALSKLGLNIAERPQEIRAAAARPPARLIVALDLTASREATLEKARLATAEMFGAMGAVGPVQLRLVYFRGLNETKKSRWHEDPAILCASMQKLACEAGATQIARTLRLALGEEENISSLVYIGDCCEEEPDELVVLAQELGRKGIPLWMFHECDDHDWDSIRAKPVFKTMAKASGGVYVEFKPESSLVLRELLASVAAYSASGPDGVRKLETATTQEGQHLQRRLLLGGGDGQ